MSEYIVLHCVFVNNFVIWEMYDAIQFLICIFFLRTERLNSNFVIIRFASNKFVFISSFPLCVYVFSLFLPHFDHFNKTR
jgi:hypothetical protein